MSAPGEREASTVPEPGPHGGDGPAVAAALGLPADAVLDLSVSVNPVAPDSSVLLRRHLDAVRRYPDPTRATAALAEAIGVPRELVLLTNGGAEAIALVAAEQLVGWVDEPDFSLYARHLTRVESSAPRWRSNPHNPSGRLARDDEPAGVWDEAFYPLATGRWTRGDTASGSVVLGSLTKLLACPGLRVGYVLAADPGLVDRLAARQPRWAVNGIAAAALPELLAAVDLPAWSSAVIRLRSQLVDVLAGHGLEVEDTDACWVLVHGVRGLRAALAHHGVVVRDCTSFGLPGTMRIAVPNERGLDRLDRILPAALAFCDDPPPLRVGTSSQDGGGEGWADRPVEPLDEVAMAGARARHDRLTKPRGSLGHLEDLGVQLAGITGTCPPRLPEPAVVVVFAADHGVATAGVTPWPQDVTAQMVANLAAGGAAINVLAAQVEATVQVVDIGVASPLPPGLDVLDRRVRHGTADLSQGPAMTASDVGAALDVGAELAATLVGTGHRCLVTGEMGIGSTTAAAAVVAALTGRPAVEVTGRGTGIDDETLARKRQIVDTAVARLGGRRDDPLAVLAEVGGLEIAALAGLCVGGAARGVPVVVDGLIAGAALLAADHLAPGTAARCIAGHRSTEPGATVVLEHLAMTPLLDLELRLGEGTGACLALPLLRAAAAVLADMATFDDAHVTDAGT